MNSEEGNNKVRGELEIEIDELSETNDNDIQQSDQGKSCKVSKIQNGINEQYKLNNNVEDNGDKSSIVSNGSSSRQDDNINVQENITHIITTTTTTNNTSSTTSSNDIQDDAEMRNNVDYICGINKFSPKVSCSTSASPDVDSTWSSGNCISSETTLNNIGGSIGSTSQGTCCFLRPNINGNRDVAGPSGLQRVCDN